MNKEIKIYGTIGCGTTTAIGIIDQIEKAKQAGAKSITLRMHSEGGSVIDGNAIFNVIHQCEIPTKVVIEGIAASMASIVILAADEVEICENAFIMIHRPSMSDSGDYDTLTQSVKVLKAIENNFLDCYSHKTGLSTAKIKSLWLDGKDHWLNADEAVKLGLADRKVASVVKGVSIDATKNIQLIYNKFAAKLNIKNSMNMKEELIKRLHLQGVDGDSTDIEVLDKLEEVFKLMEKDKDTVEENAVETVVEAAIRSGKILASTKATYMQIGKTSGIGSLNTVFESIPSFRPLATYIRPEIRTNAFGDNSPGSSANIRHNRSAWGLDEYRKYAPQALKDNPKLYDELYSKEYGKTSKLQTGRRMAYLKKCIKAQQLMMKHEDNTTVRCRVFEEHVQPVLMCSYQHYNNMLNESNPQKQLDELITNN